MDKEPKSQKDERDSVFSAFSQKLAEVADLKEREDLQRSFTKVLDAVYLADDDYTYDMYQKKRAKKFAYQMVAGILIGIVLALVPSFIYVAHIRGDRNESRVFHYIPNAKAYRKPAYLQSIKTQEVADIVKKEMIRNADLAGVGAYLKLDKMGLAVLSKEEMTSPYFHTKDVGPQKAKAEQVGNFQFIPDTLFTVDPLFIEILYSQGEVWRAKNMAGLHNKELLEVGAAISCPSSVCFVIAKELLASEYDKVTTLVGDNLHLPVM